MYRFILTTLLSIFYATPALANGFDQKINEAIKPVSDGAVSVMFYATPIMGQEVPLIIIWLMLVGIFTTFYYGFVNLRLFKLTIELLAGKHHSEEGHGEISNWQALSTSLSSTVGLGNIAGVAVAVSIGGPGATVWMILMGLLGMSTKFVECALGVKYRQIDKEGHASGGPMYYIQEGFSARGLAPLGKILAIFFAICCIGGALGGGNMFQSNQTFAMFTRVVGEESFITQNGGIFGLILAFIAQNGWLFGLILAFLVGLAIIGGIKSIARVSEKIFPTMAGIYLLSALFIIGSNIEMLPDAVMSIINGAFAPISVGGGILGVLVAGVQRAVFSNESGVGSAAITYAAVKSDSHIGQGLISMLNPFIDTVVICTLTALVIAITGVYVDGSGVEGVTLTAKAFATLGDWTIYWLALTVFLFAYSTLIAWYYLGEKAFIYLVGSRGKKDINVYIFKVIYCVFVVVGAAANLSDVVNLTDALFFAMAIPNVIAIYMMAPEIKRDLKAYLVELAKEKE